MSKIVRLTVNNLLRIRAAEVTPDGSLVIVGGENDQGKSSLLNSIAIALSGKDLPTQPIRKGAASGHVILETEEFVITRKFSLSGGGSLEVRDKDGAKVTPPQEKLNTLVSRVTFDPFEFTRMDDKAQLETVRKIVGLDFTALDSEYKTTYAARTVKNREVDAQEFRLKEIKRHDDAPKELISSEELANRLTEAQKWNAENQDKREALAEMNDDVDRHAERVQIATNRIHELEKQLEAARVELDSQREMWEKQIKMRDDQKVRVSELLDVPIDPILQQIRDADMQNAKLRDNQQWNAAHRDLLRIQEEARALSARLAEIEKTKAEKLEKTEFPIEGLGFSESGVLYNGVPFAQAGTAVKIRTSLAIARSLNPKLPVMLIRDGSLLDKERLALVREEADKFGTQVWLEVVGDREDATVIIEDGEVIATPAADAKRGKKLTKDHPAAKQALKEGTPIV